MVKRLKDKNAPKRPLSGFILYGNHIRNTNESVKAMPIRDQASAIGKMWKEADDSTKDKFNKEADKLKEEYVIKRAEYEKTDEYRDFIQQSKGEAKTKALTKRKTTRTTGMQLFQAENKRLLAQEGEDASDKRVSANWNDLSEAEKEKYNQEAAKLNKKADN